MPDTIIYLRLKFEYLLTEAVCHLPEQRRIQSDAVSLHAHQYGHKRHLNLGKKFPQFLLRKFRLQNLSQSAGDIGIGAGVLLSILNRYPGHVNLLGAGAD